MAMPADGGVRDERAWWRRSPVVRVVVIVAVVLALVAAGQAYFGHASRSLEARVEQVKREATAASRRLDVERFAEVWRQQVADSSPQPGASAAPRLPGAGTPAALVPAGQPTQVILDYPVTVDGHEGCVRIVGTEGKLVVLAEELRCAQAFSSGP